MLPIKVFILNSDLLDTQFFEQGLPAIHELHDQVLIKYQSLVFTQILHCILCHQITYDNKAAEKELTSISIS